MTDARQVTLGKEWKERLGLTNRAAPELYESVESVGDTPHAVAIRTALDALGLTAMFCVQGVPTIAILSVETYDQKKIINLHGALWNQGLASLLLVIAGDTLRAFSLARMPYRELGDEFDSRCLIKALEATADALEFRNLIYGAESGRLWKEYANHFKPKERIDQVLLDNLTESHRALVENDLSSDAAQALLIQTMFLAYLEDREIIGAEDFRAASRNTADNLSSLLATQDTKLLKALFASLKDDFNGDLFVAPCSFESKAKAPPISGAHLEILARFRTGKEVMAAGGSQYRFWGYNFRYIPIELVSAVYDRFLGEREKERREQGAYYTPMFVADTVVSQLWQLLPLDTKEKGQFLDPACGSGVFLVRSFQRLCEQWRATRKQRTIRWDSLLTILRRIHGWDLNGSAVRVAVFSLYVALLEEVSPPELRSLRKQGKVLPELWSKNLVCRNFFDVPNGQQQFDVIVGNPPWTSRRGPKRASVRWCKRNNLPMPGGEDAWAFTWKALSHLSKTGIVGFLLPAMGFLHNHAANCVSARNLLLRNTRVRRIINFADLRFQLFDGAVRPAAFIIFGKNETSNAPYKFDYWFPKADLNLQIKRFITLSSVDKALLSSEAAIADSLEFKRRLWMRKPDEKLFAYLMRLPKLGGLVKDYKSVSRKPETLKGQWIIGQGYQPHNDHLERRSSYSVSQYVGKLPDLPIEAFQRLSLPVSGLAPWGSKRVRRKGFENGFTGARILIPRGVETARTGLRAAYTEAPLTFQHIVQAITVPAGQEVRAKLLTALLNSSVAAWFAFHGTASFGSDRPEVQQAELLHLPFPAASDLPEPKRAENAARKLVAIVDDAINRANATFALTSDDDAILGEIDRLAHEYFCLSADEITLIEDTITKIIPAVQPRQGNYPALWKAPTEDERNDYAATLVRSARVWFSKKCAINARLEAASADLGIIRLTLGETAGFAAGDPISRASFDQVLSRVFQHIHQPLGGNFQLIPDLHVFIGSDLYLIKPMQLRFWLKSSALADANSIAMDLQDAVEIERQRGHA